jgi:hypothetical protein
MSTAKHTPGPWFYRKGDEWSHSVVTHHGELPDGSINCWTVASINKRREPEHEANARLIAAAPELLGALQAMYAMDWRAGPSGDEYERARTAIATATGSAQ